MRTRRPIIPQPVRGEIRAALARHNIRLSAVSEKTGIPFVRMSQLMNGRVAPADGELHAIVEATVALVEHAR